MSIKYLNLLRIRINNLVYMIENMNVLSYTFESNDGGKRKKYKISREIPIPTI